jgi:hypothetical protein
MKTFTEYANEQLVFEQYLEENTLEQLLDDYLVSEGLGDELRKRALMAAGLLDAGISGTGGVGKQILRGVGNMAGGVTGGGFRQLGKGAAQIAASPATGAVRAYQAFRDPFGELPIGGPVAQALGIGRRKDIDDYIADKRSPDDYVVPPPVDDVTAAQQSGDLRKLIELWKKAQAMARDGKDVDQAIKQRRKAARAMKAIAPEWFDAQIRRAKLKRPRSTGTDHGDSV